MTPKRPAPPPIETLSAVIQSAKPSYFIADDTSGNEGRILTDEAILDIDANIIDISYLPKKHAEKPISIQMVSASKYGSDGGIKTASVLLSITLRGNVRSLLYYSPAAAFWHLASLIIARTITHVDVRFDRPAYGSGRVDNLHFR